MEKLEERILNLIKNLEEEKRLADKRAKQLFLAGGTSDKISEGDSKVEVVDLGTGYIQTLADNQQVRKDQVLGNIQPLQPAFLAYMSAQRDNVTGDGTLYTMPFDSEVFDKGGNFNTGTYRFTAPVAGTLILNTIVRFQGSVEAHGRFDVQFVTSNRIIYVAAGHLFNVSDTYYLHRFSRSYLVIADMDANDTVYINTAAGTAGDAKVVDIAGGSAEITRFSGALLC